MNETSTHEHEPDGPIARGTECLHCDAVIAEVSGPADDLAIEWQS